MFEVVITEVKPFEKPETVPANYPTTYGVPYQRNEVLRQTVETLDLQDVICAVNRIGRIGRPRGKASAKASQTA